MASLEFVTIADVSKEDGAPLISGIHSGNAGDIVYSLPAIRALGINHIILNAFISRTDPVRQLPEPTARALAPLLLAQDHIQRVTIVRCGVPLETALDGCLTVNYNLDRFRLQDTSQLHLIQAHARAMNVRVDPNVPFLRLAGPARSRSGVVIALTPRYKSLSDDVLRDLMLYFDNPILLGIPEEWRTVSGISGLLTTCEDFLEMAQIIASAALFVGNPGLPYAIAEGLKVLRIVDIPLEPANAFPLGPRGYLIPAERRAFATMLARLCASDGELAACCRLKPLYDDLLKNMQQLQEESRRLCGTGDAATALHAAGPVDLGCLAAGGKAQGINLPGAESLIPQNGGLLLHPNDPGQSRAEAAFADLYLAGHNCFETGLHVDHPLSGPVRFHLRMEYADGAADERFTDVFPTDPVPWRVWFKRTYGPVRVVLGTEMAPGAASRNCAWAVFDRPRLCVL